MTAASTGITAVRELEEVVMADDKQKGQPVREREDVPEAQKAGQVGTHTRKEAREARGAGDEVPTARDIRGDEDVTQTEDSSRSTD